MKISDLNFEFTGCCGGEASAKVVHENGLMTQVYQSDDGTYAAVTYAGGAIYRPIQTGMSDADAELRIDADAAI